MSNNNRYIAHETVVLPLKAALDLLASVAPAPSYRAQFAKVIQEARLALQQVEGIVPPARNVLEGFIGPFGPLEAILSHAQEEAADRQKAHSDAAATASATQLTAELLELVCGLASTVETGRALVATFMAQNSAVVADLIAAAQRDGWSPVTEEGSQVNVAKAIFVERLQALVTQALDSRE